MAQTKTALSIVEPGDLKPTYLSPFEIVEKYFRLTENSAVSPEEQALRDKIRENALAHDIILGLFP